MSRARLATDAPPIGDVPSSTAGSTPIWLTAYAARSCPVKTHNLYDPTVPTFRWRPDTAVQQLFNGGDGFEPFVVDQLAAQSGLRVLDLRTLQDQPAPVQQAAASRAVADGVDVIVGALLPVDPSAGRVGSVDLLMRGADRADGRPGYHAGEVKWHKLHERRTLTVESRPNTSLLLAELDRPLLGQARRKWGYGFRVGSRETDLLQVAHYQRMLAAAGWEAPGPPTAMLIGTDDWAGRTLVTWVDLSEPLIRSFARHSDGGWVLRSALQRYDHEFAFRREVAEVARQQGEPAAPAPLVSPIVVKECAHCEWWSHCLSQLDPDDISLRIGTGALDVREVSTLRAQGIRTVHQLAAADLAEAAAWYLPEVAHRSTAADRLQAAARRARMLVEDIDFVRVSAGPVELPEFDQEIDFDVETSADGRVYLWGFLLNRPDGPEYRAFARFEDLTEAGERSLAVEALSWLRTQVLDHDGRTGVFHYSEFEVNHLHRLAEQAGQPGRSGHGDPYRELFAWADAFASGTRPDAVPDGGDRGGFVDLLGVVKATFFGARGLGLKVVASSGAGLCWRDDDPGGLNSQVWFMDAVHADSPEARRSARERVLAYNEDDVVATSRVRAWLRSLT